MHLTKRLIALVAVSQLLVSCAATDATTTMGSTTVPATAAPSEATSRPVDFDVQGHRGARGLQPENTLPAFETALDLGVDTLELDLHFTADGKIVIWHDPIVPPDKCRLDPGGPGGEPDPATADPADLAVAGFTRLELNAYICDKNPDEARFPDQQPRGTALAGDAYRLATLAELFDFVADYAESDAKTPEQRNAAASVAFNIETKRDPANPETINDGFDGKNPGPFEIALLDLIAERGLSERVVIQSFDHRSLRAIRSINGTIRLAALTSRNVAFETSFAEFANIWSPDSRSVSASSLETAHAAGLQVIPWTVNEASDMTRLIVLGVDGLITDRPDILLAVVADTG